MPSADDAQLRKEALRNAAAVLRGRRTARLELEQRTHELAEAEAALRDESRALELLNNVGLRLAAELDLKPLLQAVTDACREITAADLVGFLPSDGPSTGGTLGYALSGAPHRAVGLMGHLRSTKLFIRTLVHGGRLRIDDVAADGRYGAWAPQHGLPAEDPPVRSYLAVPVLARSGEVLGGLFLGHAEPAFFSDRDERLVVGLAAQAAAAIQNARLYEREREARQAAEQARAELERRVGERTEALALVNRELEAFAYSVSHDLRSPLSRVGGFARALLESTEGPLSERQQHYLNRIRANVDDMAGMIEASLALAHLSWMPLSTKRVDLSAAAAQIVAGLAEQEPLRSCRVGIAPGLQADGDPVLVTMLLDNLLRNAWKFTGRTAQPQISFDRHPAPDGQPVFRVRDNGAGFDMRFADRLFFPFQRLHNPDEFAGNGVGLATVRRICERHGGGVWAQAAPGEGATFFFTLQPRA